MIKRFFKFIVQHYLRFLTKFILWRHRPFVVAIAGSTNKTFTKETILDYLGRREEVRGNPKSFNTEIGLPLAVLFLPSGYSSFFKWADVLISGTFISFFSRKFPKVLILEMGVDKVGDMKYLLSIVRPNIAVVTNIKSSFPDGGIAPEELAREFSLLVKAVPKNGLVVLNKDDERVANLAKQVDTKVVFFGEKEGSDYLIKNITLNGEGQKFEIYFDGKTKKIETEKFGRHNINALVIAEIVSTKIKRLFPGEFEK